MRKLSITYKLIAVYLVIAIPLLAVISIVYISWYQERVERALMRRQELATLAGTSFTFYIRDINGSMKFVSIPITENELPDIGATEALSSLLQAYPIDYALITDTIGKVTISTDKRLLGQDLSKNPAFSAIIYNNDPTGISPSEETNGKRGFYTAQAVKSNGKLQMITASFIDIAKLNKTLKIKSAGGGINIIDSSGYLVYQSEMPKLAETGSYWGKYGFVKVALSGKSANNTNWISPVNHRAKIIVEVPVSEIGWAAGSEIDRSIALAPVRLAAMKTSILATVFMLMALTLSIRFARRIVRPLFTLVNASRAVGEGKLDEPIAITTGDEIEDLANSLDKARQNLRENIDELRKARDELEIRVEERTSQLEIANKRLSLEISRVVQLQQIVENQLSLLQQALIPPAPQVISGYRVATVYLPTVQRQNIGGDLYDVFMTEKGKIVVMIGDVSGKGIEAAALAASARSTVHSFAYELGYPDTAMYHANAVLQSQISDTRDFVTMLLAIIDPSTGVLSYSRAGHPPAVILRRGGNVEFLQEGEMPIGLFAGQKYGRFENHLNLGDRIILYTDGIIEARHDGKLFDLEGVEQTLATFKDVSPDEIAEGLTEEARKWSEDNLQDDIAILVIERAENK